MKYFEPPYTKENLKKQFRELSKKLHPDKDKDASASNAGAFVEMMRQYEYLKKIIDKPPAPKKRPPVRNKKSNTFVKNINITIDARSIEKLIKKYLR